MGSLKHGAAALAWLLCAAGAHAADGTRGPQRNLMIEVRQGDGAELGVSGASVQPGVTVRSDGRITGAVSGGIEARTVRRGTQAVQRVVVVNGGRAGIRLGSSQAVQLWDVAWTGQGPQVVPSTHWVEAGRGFNVRPSWPGEGSPVTLEVEAQSTQLRDPVARAMATEPNAQDGNVPVATDGAQVLTTVRVPLGEWVTIAGSGDESSGGSRGVLSSREVSRSGHYIVQVRVSVP
jgi:hypothetical protein